MLAPTLPLLDATDLADCFAYAERAWENESKKDFGTEERKRLESIADHVEGKLTEKALQKLFAAYGLPVQLDFQIYAGTENLDNGDLKQVFVNGRWATPPDKLLDTKGTTMAGRWLLVEEYKYFPGCQYYVFIRLDLPRNDDLRKDPYQIRYREEIGWEPVGWAPRTEFICPTTGQFWFTYRKGADLYRTAHLPRSRPTSFESLQAYLNTHNVGRFRFNQRAKLNYGLPEPWLRTNWWELIDRVRKACGG